MEKKTMGAWLLSQSRTLDAVNGAARLENIQYAGRAGRLFNLLRRTSNDTDSPTLSSAEVSNICQLNDIDRSVREAGLGVLARFGYVDTASNGAVSVLGATSTAVLEAAAKIFEGTNPANEELAVLDLSEQVADKPRERSDISQYVGDTYHLSRNEVTGLIDLCNDTALLDQSEDRGLTILFNNNTFRDQQYATKAYRLLAGLTAQEQRALTELKELMTRRGAILDSDATKILGLPLYRRAVGVGLFDRLEVSNSSEAVGYLTSPDNFQRFGRPFEADPIDDAKALLASLTYGMTRSAPGRGEIRYPSALLRHLVAGEEVGGRYGATAIGEDYRELEKRQVVKLTRRSQSRYVMHLLKPDVGELALGIIQGSPAATEALLMEGAPASGFSGPGETRRKIRRKHTLDDKQFVTSALDRMRSGS